MQKSSIASEDLSAIVFALIRDRSYTLGVHRCLQKSFDVVKINPVSWLTKPQFDGPVPVHSWFSGLNWEEQDCEAWYFFCYIVPKKLWSYECIMVLLEITTDMLGEKDEAVCCHFFVMQ